MSCGFLWCNDVKTTQEKIHFLSCFLCNMYSTSSYFTVHHERFYLLILKCLFPILDSLDFLMPCQYRIWGSPSFWVKCAYGHFLLLISPQDLKSTYLEFLWPSCISYSWMVVRLFKDDESCVSLESSTPSVDMSGCPATRYGVHIPLKVQAMLATLDIKLHFWLVRFHLTPCQWIYISCAHFTHFFHVHRTSVNYWVLRLPPP